MAKSEKTLNKMIANPKDWRIEQLETIAKQYGVSVRKTGPTRVFLIMMIGLSFFVFLLIVQ